ncbi:hypothetical protein FB545_1814 [Peribacillus frigoritolerans]|uniref:hypothetical protein n=1 Tax=Peribacillus frigoritolerans TaxID=450367 RepID=UPI00119C43C9|nr:hypothetical protein [Peribacillus frigoritolerans]TWE04710.1 hypothetical protein FB545_1814 [Peribacillus frigoritolerans]
MFDPTAFENMKVVLEGAVYDRDFIGDILVINRDDIVNLSTMSRLYKIEMELKKTNAPISISGAIELHASLHNLSSELLDAAIDDAHSGCTVNIFISFPKKLDDVNAEQFMSDLEKIWGDQRIISVTTSETVSKKMQPITSSIYKISFGRLVREEQMDDLEDMVEYLIQSIQAVKIPG